MNDTVSAAVAIAVAAAADDEGLAQEPLSDPIQQIHTPCGDRSIPASNGIPG